MGRAIKTVAELQGHTFAFGAPSSTSGSLMPRHFLQQQGLVPERDFRTVAFSGAHAATVAFVASGRAEAGVLNASVMDKLVEEKNPNAAKVRVLATTPPFFDYNWAVLPGLDPALTKKLTDAFLALDASKHGVPLGMRGTRGGGDGLRRRRRARADVLYFHLSLFQPPQAATVLAGMIALVVASDTLSGRIRRAPNAESH